MDRTEYQMLRRLIRRARREDRQEPILASTKIMRLRQPSREQRLLELVPARARPAMERRGDIHVASPLLRGRLNQWRENRGRSTSMARAIDAYRRHFPIAA